MSSTTSASEEKTLGLGDDVPDLSNGADLHESTLDAIKAEHAEKDMPLWQVFYVYRKAIGWSIAVSFCLIMEGYMTSVLGNVSAYPLYREKFGVYTGPTNGYQVTAAWSSAVSQGSTVGVILGVFIASWMQDIWGYRRTIQLNLILITGFIFVTFYAPNVKILFLGNLLCGFPWGAFSSCAVAYATEISPVKLRGYLTTYVNMCWLIGQIIAAGVALALENRTDEWAYRIQFAIQWIFPVPIFIAVTFAPESPWFYVRKNKLKEAERMVQRLAADGNEVSPADVVAMMVRTNRIEVETREGTNYWDCFKGPNLRRTEIACVAWMSTVLAGSSFANHPAYFLEQAGLSTTAALQVNLGQRALAMIGTILSWVVMTRFGRRNTFIWGLIGDALCLLIVGILAIPGQTQVGPRWGEAAMILLWVFIWDFSVTVTAYAIVGETSSTRLRARTVGLARAMYDVIGIPIGIIETYQVNASAWNWKGLSGFFYFGTCLIAIVWAYYRLPEMKGRTFRELDILFERNIPAREFHKTEIKDEDES